MTEFAKPPVDTLARITGFLSDDKKTGGLSGVIGIEGAEYDVSVDANPKKSKAGNDFYSFSANAKADAEPKSFNGALFRTQHFGVLGKPGLNLKFELARNGETSAFNVVGFFKDRNADGSKIYKNPLYTLSNERPRT
jgi:hypothetical protein